MNIPDSIREQINLLPKTPGIYFFKNKAGEVLYVGKATSLRDRVRSYWAKELNRAESIQQMVRLIDRIDIEQSDSTVEALIAEANYIKHYLPKYNVIFRDDKSYFYVKLDNSDGTGFPRLSLVHKNQIVFDEKGLRYFGPYTSSKNLRLALKIIRKIFPYRTCTVMPKKACIQYHIHRCPAPCISKIEQVAYNKSIKHIVMVLEGKKQQLLKSLKREMDALSKTQNYEQAAQVRNQYVALQHLHEAGRIADYDLEVKPEPGKEDSAPHRIEGYDVSNLNGKEAVVAMVVFIYGQAAKHLYKRFKIKTVSGPNDYAMLQEAIERRLNRAEQDMVNEKTWEFADDEGWGLPNVMIIDGGKGQLSAVEHIVAKHNITMPLVGIAKGKERKNEDLYFAGDSSFRDTAIIRAVRDEAHRFSGAYHRTLRTKRMIHSELNEIPGIGVARRQLLLQHFGSVSAIKSSSQADLEQILGLKVGQKLYGVLHQD